MKERRQIYDQVTELIETIKAGVTHATAPQVVARVQQGLWATGTDGGRRGRVLPTRPARRRPRWVTHRPGDGRATGGSHPLTCENAA